MATFNKFEQFVEEVMHGAHNLGTGAITLAFTPNASTPDAQDAVLADLTGAISTANMDDITPTTASSGQTSGTYALVMTDHTITASNTVPTFRQVVHYNDTHASDGLICWHDHGSDVDLATSETYDLDYGANLLSLT